MPHELLKAKKAHVDKSGRFTIPKEVREQLVGDVEGIFWWFDGRRLHVASSKELAKFAASLGPRRKRKRHGPASR